MPSSLEAELLRALAQARAGRGAVDAILVQALDAEGLPTALHLRLAVHDPSSYELQVPLTALESCPAPLHARAQLVDLGLSLEGDHWASRFYAPEPLVRLARQVHTEIFASSEADFLLTEN